LLTRITAEPQKGAASEHEAEMEFVWQSQGSIFCQPCIVSLGLGTWFSGEMMQPGG
jgi:hypothetical protein